ncbi:hypothetical protein XOCgx_1516 [Xanthomonas oryzae pv. oryzicola]|nr:hypothetical protein XOCgx_1516 [Xanthomonas oryzae pv. oryzicola]
MRAERKASPTAYPELGVLGRPINIDTLCCPHGRGPCQLPSASTAIESHEHTPPNCADARCTFGAHVVWSSGIGHA